MQAHLKPKSDNLLQLRIEFLTRGNRSANKARVLLLLIDI
jgi:hypothetical protein